MDSNFNQIRNPNSRFWLGKKVLITGHTGFKGSWLSFWLEQMGANIHGVSLTPENEINLFEALKLEKKLNHNICDIRDKKSIKELINEIQPEFIFHLAAQPLVRDSYKKPILTWETNVLGTINILESLKDIKNHCCAVFITTDKVYQNNEWIFGYRENDKLGGYDPYSSSKAGAELAINSWRSSFFNPLEVNCRIKISSARAGNVIGGGDWSKDRIIPDLIRSISKNSPLEVRNAHSTRPWQHVLEPLSGYLLLAEKMHHSNKFSEAFNFGPYIESNRSVKELVEESLKIWHGEWIDLSNKEDLHEASLLNLTIEKAFNKLNWQPKWDFSKTIEKTITWYKDFYLEKANAEDCCLKNIHDFIK